MELNKPEYLPVPDNPLISVCVPAFNCGKFITETLTCLVDQTYTNIEIIVVNDGSTDDTLTKVRAIKDRRLTIIDGINKGAANARNTAYGFAHGAYVIFFDADDYVGPDFISLQARYIRGTKNDVVMAAWGRFYQEDLKSLKRDHLPGTAMTFREWVNLYWYNCNPMTNPGRALIPAALIKKAGLWNPELSLNDDLEFFTRIFLNADKIIFNAEALFHYRSGIGGLSGKKSRAAYQSSFTALAQATEMALKHFSHEGLVRQSCANLWQGLIYELYPDETEITRLAQEKVDELGGATLAFPCGGYTRYLAALVGWKLTKQLKSKLAR
ncbi:glycosyltransferase family 2 protein [Mucilaginibacter sabulilitoris]|uniref:Glycosyltransferase family 2 protein n=1 Tax=Mucilaginibacter sabulilitoris TaxID=1173583 RepID=A0ABZ0TJA7_9SPHI|nr:glycosyltransferase family 2 protein [Mucilaginibacter sabulilitoris]WPU91655.1 glycosyltransferase family 2 protein [Mucilaginibacter sabulilitoris]